MWTFEARKEKQAKERKKGIGRRGKGELKTKIEGAAKQWIWGSEQSTKGAANSEEKG